jgi:hypothetical protein
MCRSAESSGISLVEDDFDVIPNQPAGIQLGGAVARVENVAKPG